MATILLANVDLFMRGKLDAFLPSHQLITATTARPDLVICDIARVDPQEIADAHSDVPIIGSSGPRRGLEEKTWRSRSARSRGPR